MIRYSKMNINLFKLLFPRFLMENIEEAKAVQTEKKPFSWSQWYDKNYKLLMIIPILLLLASLIYIGIFVSKTGDFFYKDVSLTGGTTITVYTDKFAVADVSKAMEAKFGDVAVRSLTDVSTGKQLALTVETKANADEVKKALEDYLGFALDTNNSSVEFTGTALSQSFSNELLKALLLAFLFMAIVVFILFKNPLPCSYMILCAFADIIIPMAVIDYMGLKISTAGIAAFLMLVGYSVDSDILLTTRVLKRRGDELNKRIFSSVKTGLTMSLTSLIAVFAAYLIVISPVLKQVFLIVTIGLIVDMLTTWTVNAGLLKLYCEKRHI
jgi:preprotein translocase subunit SecF